MHDMAHIIASMYSDSRSSPRDHRSTTRDEEGTAEPAGADRSMIHEEDFGENGKTECATQPTGADRSIIGEGEFGKNGMPEWTTKYWQPPTAPLGQSASVGSLGTLSNLSAFHAHEVFEETESNSESRTEGETSLYQRRRDMSPTTPKSKFQMNTVHPGEIGGSVEAPIDCFGPAGENLEVDIQQHKGRDESSHSPFELKSDCQEKVSRPSHIYKRNDSIEHVLQYALHQEPECVLMLASDSSAAPSHGIEQEGTASSAQHYDGSKHALPDCERRVTNPAPECSPDGGLTISQQFQDAQRFRPNSIGFELSMQSDCFVRAMFQSWCSQKALQDWDVSENMVCRTLDSVFT